uniref:Apple domain-containing protein n=1 Tax=Haemonchus placei TaxID=6290 RepID=A0A158QM82_HAEPC
LILLPFLMLPILIYGSNNLPFPMEFPILSIETEKVLIGIVDQLIQGISSQAECLKRCQKSKDTSDIVCKSAVYYEKEKECVIASQSRIDIPDLFVEDEQGIYMENICLNDSGASMKKLKVKARFVISNPGDSSNMSLVLLHSKLFLWFPISLQSMSGGTVEQSGYDSPSDMIGGQSSVDELATHVFNVILLVIDSYNVDVGVKKTPIDAGYGKRLRDSRVKECFTEVRPLRPMKESRVTKAYSLEQCTDICRLCWRCLRGKKCLGVAFDISSELCALSTSHMVDGGDMQDLDGIVYHNRSDC